MKKIGKLITVIMAAFTIMGCAGCGSSGSSGGGTATGVVDLNAKESPMLTAMVKTGEIEELDERLPENPKIVPTEEYGAYGGTWRQTVTSASKGHAFYIMGYYQGMTLVSWNSDRTEIVPNIASSFTLSEDCKTLEITLRKGLKWSDGHDMNTTDVKFWWDAYAVNKEVSPSSTTWNDAQLTIVSKETFRMTFESPRPFILSTMADGSTGSYWFLPKHYLAQFHKNYNVNAERYAREAKFNSWVDYFLDRMVYHTNPDLPVMSPWKLTTDNTAATQLVLERNPYYFATDDKGRQLPYIDTCQINLVQDSNLIDNKIVSGEFEISYAGVMEDLKKYSLYAKYAESKGYTVKTTQFDEPNALNIHLNTTVRDATKRQYFSNKDFRVALSHAINRQQIIDVIYTIGGGQMTSTARQFSPIDTSPYYDKEFSEQYTQYDVEKANQLLDSIGLQNKNADGYRLMSNGQIMSIDIQVPTEYSTKWNDVAQMIVTYWEAVGIKTNAKPYDTSAWDNNRVGNNFECTLFTGGGGFEKLSEIAINDYTGYDYPGWPQTFASGAYLWRSSGGGSDEGAVEPVQAVKDLWTLGEQLSVCVDKEEQDTLAKQIIDIHKENFFIIGICTRSPAVYVVKNTLQNVPELSPSWNYGYTGHGNPDQYWLKTK